MTDVSVNGARQRPVRDLRATLLMGASSEDTIVLPAGAESPIEALLARRFFGSVKVDPVRYSRDIGNVAREIIDRLAGVGAALEITIDIQASKPEGLARPRSAPSPRARECSSTRQVAL